MLHKVKATVEAEIKADSTEEATKFFRDKIYSLPDSEGKNPCWVGSSISVLRSKTANRLSEYESEE